MAATYFTEVIFPDDPEREKMNERTPFSLIEHPFRVLVYDSEAHLLAIGTCALGPLGQPTLHAQKFAEGWAGYASASIISRVDHDIILTIAKPLKDQHASTHRTPRPE